MSVYGGGQPGYERPGQIDFDAFGQAWRLLTPQLGTWVLAFLAVIGVNFALMIALFVMIVIATMISKDLVYPAAAAFYLAVGIVGAYFSVGFYRMAVIQTRGETVNTGDLFTPIDWNAIGTALLFILITVLLGFTIVGGIIAGGVLMFAVPLSIEQRLKPIEAIRQSFDMLKKDWFMATVFYFVAVIVACIGILALGIGLFVTMPLLYLSVAVLYRRYVPASIPSQTYPGAYPGVYPAGMTPLYPSPTPPVAPLYTPPVDLTQPIYPPAQAPQPTAPLYPTDAAQPTPAETLYGAGDAVGQPSGTLQETHDPTAISASEPASSPDVTAGPRQDAEAPPTDAYTHSSDVPAPHVPNLQEMEQLASEMRSAAEPGVELGVHGVTPQDKPD